jgi:hypothetical protein
VVSNVGVSRASTLILGAGGVIALSLVAVLSRPHLSRSSLQVFAASCPCPTFHEQVTGLIVLNPLRNRAPEEAATQFLSDLKNGKCDAEETSVPGLCKAALDRRPVLDLKLRNRKDVGNTVMLFYLFKGKFRPDRGIDPEDAWGEGMVQVERTGSEWRVTNYGSRY